MSFEIGGFVFLGIYVQLDLSVTVQSQFVSLVDMESSPDARHPTVGWKVGFL